jgi:Ca2+-binding EF-hand superfamily protein
MHVSLLQAIKEDGGGELKALFDALDKDDDGSVASKEWYNSVRKNLKQLKKYFGGSSVRQVSMAFKKLDSNGDNTVTWAEFTAAVAEPEVPPSKLKGVLNKVNEV